jgi:hypothetical protein
MSIFITIVSFWILDQFYIHSSDLINVNILYMILSYMYDFLNDLRVVDDDFNFAVIVCQRSYYMLVLFFV